MITAGATREYLDPVRYLSSPSSGLTAYEIAKVACKYGTKVTLVSAKTHFDFPIHISKFITIVSAMEMYNVVQKLDCDIFIATASVADYRTTEIVKNKIKRKTAELQINLVANPDIVKSISKREIKPFIVAFAAETENDLQLGWQKLQQKNADMLVFNLVGKNLGFAVSENEYTVLIKGGSFC